jgi:asparagine synthase (glutamine-hydrolysing)
MMAGIAGIAKANKTKTISQMLAKINYRGGAWEEIRSFQGTTLGIAGTKIQQKDSIVFKNDGLARDGSLPGCFAQAQAVQEGFLLKRDPLGAAPLYYGWTRERDFCFASEVKALLVVTNDIHEVPPGCSFDGHNLKPYFQLEIKPPVQGTEDSISLELRQRLEISIENCLGDGNVGSWLSGGLDSSALAAIARQKVQKLHSFAAGLPGAPDLFFARQMANHIKSTHHEIIVKPQDILQHLSEVIYHLESFDALLVRSTILNFLLAKYASDYVPAVISGEGGDELFAGYEYLKGLQLESLPGELIDIIGRLHNTALQRVDRCASAHGTVPRLGFLDPGVVDFALRIPAEYKLKNGVEKWILRCAVKDLLPSQVLNRTKAKFWEGGGFLNLLQNYADENVSDSDFFHEKRIVNGWQLNTKEELLYYRIFREFFGAAYDIPWIGRTKYAPQR